MSDENDIQQKVDNLLALPFASGEFPVPVEKIANHLGFACYLFTPDASTADISGAVDHRSKKIFINRNDPPQRQLFTVAHEIGHIILHGDQEDYIDYRMSKNLNPKEAEANSFAAKLLMPKELFQFQWKNHRKDLKKIAKFFGVSASSAGYRAISLGLD